MNKTGMIVAFGLAASLVGGCGPDVMDLSVDTTARHFHQKFVEGCGEKDPVKTAKMASILYKTAALSDHNKDGKIKYNKFPTGMNGALEYHYTPEADVMDNFIVMREENVKICFGRQQHPVVYSPDSRTIAIGESLPETEAAQSLASFIAEKPTNFWTLKPGS